MDDLDGTDYDILIAGTGLQEALLALALSRSGKKVLHVDRNDYYGASVAALNLRDADSWVDNVNAKSNYHQIFSSALVSASANTQVNRITRLGSPRRYSLALSPSIILARSTLLSSLVSARVDQQIDFVANGSTWLLSSASFPSSTAAPSKSDIASKEATPEEPRSTPRLVKVPSSREDIVSDPTVDRKASRSIIKFLRFVTNLDTQEKTWTESTDQPFDQFLSQKFGLSVDVQRPIHALTLSSAAPGATKSGWALRRIESILRSMNFLGLGFASVLPKWGGLAEVVQVSCRALAVGAGVYVLGKGVTDVRRNEAGQRRLALKLDGDINVKTDLLVCGYDNALQGVFQGIDTAPSSHSVSVISSSLASLFSRPTEESPEPAGAVVNVSSLDGEPPVIIVARSAASGECPEGQCILYASTAKPNAFEILDSAVASLITETDATAEVLWRLTYQRESAQHDALVQRPMDGVRVFPPLETNLLFDDRVLDLVKEVWRDVTGPEADDENFLKFSPREGESLDEDEV